MNILAGPRLTMIKSSHLTYLFTVQLYCMFLTLYVLLNALCLGPQLLQGVVLVLLGVPQLMQGEILVLLYGPHVLQGEVVVVSEVILHWPETLVVMVLN